MMLALLAALTAVAPVTAMTDDACARIDAQVRQRPQAEQDAARRQLDWPNLCRYAPDNAAVTAPPRIVFIGDSITEFWKREHPAFFSAAVLDRGISGQTSEQILLRFYQDVIQLKPVAVHILAGGNDVAGNTGPIAMASWQNNIRAMVELARAHRIRIVLGSMLPADAFWWNPAMRPAAKLVELNGWLRSYARDEGIGFADYYPAMSKPDGAMKRELTDDGVHPNKRGYAVMQTVVEPILRDLSN